jgi:hypothetical protein
MIPQEETGDGDMGMGMGDATAPAYQAQWQRSALQHRRAIWTLLGAGERVEVSMEAAKRDLLGLRSGGSAAVAVEDVDLRQRIAHLQGDLAGAEVEYRRITRAIYAHLQAVSWLQRQLQFRA